ncbi:MAG TPA: DUF1361 domain-containing protein [Verrucomicrobiae bacterium]|nr:DUF1361 domain-containing protein [Verrucomicrobiae bacterium]
MNPSSTSPNPPANWPRLFLPVFAVAFASAIACVLLGARIFLSGSWRQLYLPWNLFLAWLPLVLAWRAACADTESSPGRWRFRAYALAWLLLFPNAPYILTDLAHLPPNFHGHFWGDLVLILLFALTGLVLGFLSLYHMQMLVARRFGWVTGWLFAVAASGLSAIGICIGRFLRWNSWDVLLNPIGLLADITRWLVSIPASPRLFLLPALFATLLFVAYVLLYAVTLLPSPPIVAKLSTSSS